MSDVSAYFNINKAVLAMKYHVAVSLLVHNKIEPLADIHNGICIW